MPLTLALVGAGHAHLPVLAKAERLRASGIEPVLIAPDTFDYSGLASGVLSGALAPESARIDVAALARANGVLHRATEVISIDRDARTLRLGDGSLQSYDAVSFNIGSAVCDPHGWIGREGVWPVKPLSSLFALRQTLETAFAGDTTPAIVVAGDGPTGFEIAAVLTGLHERHGRTPSLTLVGPDADARWAPGHAGRRLITRLDRRGVRLIASGVAEHEAGRIILSDGSSLSCDHLVLATGLQAPALTRALGVPLDEAERIKVAPDLSSIGDDRVFAVGDCATIAGHPRPFAGVFGVRAAATLINNLCGLGSGEPRRAYRPQDRWLSILDLGDRTGLAMRGDLWWQGRMALDVKRHLDIGFVKRSRA